MIYGVFNDSWLSYYSSKSEHGAKTKSVTEIRIRYKKDTAKILFYFRSAIKLNGETRF